MRLSKSSACLVGIFSLSTLLTACGGGGGSDSSKTNPPPPSNEAPVIATEAFPTVVNPQQQITISATRSTDSDGNIDSFSWQQLSGPTVTFVDAQSPELQFTVPDEQGAVIEVELTVTDNDGASSTETFTITLNSAPDVVIDADNEGMERSTLSLDASQSSDANGDIDTYVWEQTAGPEARFTAPTSAQTDLILPEVDEETELTFLLTITDTLLLTATKTISVTVLPNDAPQISLVMPPESARFFDDHIHVRGTVSDDQAPDTNTITVSINGTEHEVDVTDAGNWQAELPVTASGAALEVGAYSTDNYGEQSETRSFALEYLPTLSSGLIALDPSRDNVAYVISKTDFEIGVKVLEVNLATDERQVLVDTRLIDDVDINDVQQIALDTANNRLLMRTNTLEHAFTAFDLDNQTFSSLFTSEDLSGSVRRFALSQDGTSVYLIDWDSNELIKADLTSGATEVISGPSKGAGLSFDFSYNDFVFVDADGQIIVYDDGRNAVFSVDEGTGDRTVLSSYGLSVGSGEANLNVEILTINRAMDKLVGVTPYNDMLEVNLITGERTVVAALPELGSMFNATNMVWDADAQHYIISMLEADSDSAGTQIVAVDVEGNLSVLIDDAVGDDNNALQLTSALTLDSDNDRLFALAKSNDGANDYHLVDVSTSSHAVNSIVQDNPLLERAIGLTYNSADGLLYFGSYSEKAVYSADPVSGAIIKVADLDLAEAGETVIPVDLTVNPSGTALYIAARTADETPYIAEVVLESGAVNLVTSNDTGLNSSLIATRTIAATDDTVFVGDEGTGGTDSITLQKIDIATGDTVILAENDGNADFFFNSVDDLWLDEQNARLILAHDGALSVFDTQTGERNKLSESQNRYTAGTGNGEGKFNRVTGAVNDGYVYVLDYAVHALFLVDTVTGDRFMVQR